MEVLGGSLSVAGILMQNGAGALTAAHLKNSARTWKSLRPLKITSSIFKDMPWPGHIVLSSVNQPSFI